MSFDLAHSAIHEEAGATSSNAEPAIRVAGLSKCYRVYRRPQDRLKQAIVPRLLGALGRPPKSYGREFWALRDVSFVIGRGEVVGIIGSNGSGKSTLLQIVCGTLGATTGTVAVAGRVAALLELGSGFDPECSGRENVFLNGQLLGLSRDEVAGAFDAIAAFADIGDHIDQPVKTYSSGMFVRLAFAIAIHVEPEILIVDEALSVGDIAFQNKCLERIKKLVERGATILFVSHDISTLQLICSRAIWLDHGRIRADGDPVRVTQDYYIHVVAGHTQPAAAAIAQQETGKAHFIELAVESARDATFSPGDRLAIRFTLEAKDDLPALVFAISIYRSDGDWLVGQTSADTGVTWPALARGATCGGTLELAPLCLAPGDYTLAFGAYSADYSLCLAMTHACAHFSVRSDFPTWGKILHPCHWKVS